MKKLAFFVTIVFLIAGCKKNNDTTTTKQPTYTVPTTYSFPSFSDTNSLKLLAMADQIGAMINTANVKGGKAVSTQVLTSLFNNTGGYFVDSALRLNSSGLRLADYVSAAQKTDLLNYFDSVGLYSQSTTTASAGVAGVSPSSASPNKLYLLSPNGVFYSQVVKKTMQGMTGYAIGNLYLADSINTSSDTNVLKHYWDAAFGLFGVPVNFPTVVTGLRYWGSYSNQVNAGFHANTSIMNAFLIGRAAISNNDLTTMKTQANILIRSFDTLNAAAIVQEMHETNTNVEAGDAVAAYGTLSESLGFVRDLIYNTSSTRVITPAQITQLLALYDASNPNNPNLYNFLGVSAGLTVAQIEQKTNAIAQLIGQIYGFSNTQLPLL